MARVSGISQRMLTTTLRYLERDGILTRRLYPQVPPRVEYSLSERGSRLLVPVKAIVTLVQHDWTEIGKAREDYDRRYAKTRSAQPEVIDTRFERHGKRSVNAEAFGDALTIGLRCSAGESRRPGHIDLWCNPK